MRTPDSKDLRVSVSLNDWQWVRLSSTCLPGVLFHVIHASVFSLPLRGFVPSGADELGEPHYWAVASCLWSSSAGMGTSAAVTTAPLARPCPTPKLLKYTCVNTNLTPLHINSFVLMLLFGGCACRRHYITIKRWSEHYTADNPPFF